MIFLDEPFDSSRKTLAFVKTQREKGESYCVTVIYIYIYTARTGVLPGKVRFDCAGPVFCEILHVVRLPKRMTKIFPVTFSHFYSSSSSSSSAAAGQITQLSSDKPMSLILYCFLCRARGKSSRASKWDPWNPKETLQKPWRKPKETLHEPRQKPIFFAMSLGCAYAGACALLTRAQFKLTRQHWETTSLRGAYAPGNVEKWYLTTGFAYASRCFQPRGTLLEDFVHEHACISDRGAMCFKKIKHSFQWLGFFRPLQVRKGFCLGRHVGYCSKSQHQLTRCLRGAYAELYAEWRPWCCLTMTIMEKIKNLRENVEGNHSWGNHWSKPDDYMLWSLHAVPHDASCHDSPTSTCQNPQVKPNRNLNLYFDLHIPHMCLRTVLTHHILSKTAYATLRRPGFCLRLAPNVHMTGP